MSGAETVNENVNSRTVQLVKLLSEVGPDIPEISRRLAQFKESVRYRYKEKIINKGFAVQAAPDHERLGLRRRVAIAEVSEEYRNYADSIFTAMNELCYLVGFIRTLIGGEYILNFSIPEQYVGETTGFLNGLKEKGFFTKVEILEFDWFRIAPMKSEYYDFDTGRWDFQWQNPSSQDAQAAAFLPSGGAKFDAVDLLIIKELQVDANKSLKEIADKLSINYKKLAWHYASHVVARKLLRGYAINWTGTRYDQVIEKALHRKHRYFALLLVARNPSEYELMSLRANMTMLPFLWAEASGKDYFAQLFVPVDFVVEGLQYLGKATNSIKDKISIYTLDQTNALGFTISYNLFDTAAKKWMFERQQLESRFGNLMLEIKGIKGGSRDQPS